jgi:hypothetical protein
VCCRDEFLAVADLLLFDFGGDVVDCPAFRYQNRADKNPPVCDLPESLAGIERLVEKVFTCLQGSAEMPVAEERECQSAAYHIVVPQYSGYAPSRGAFGNVNEDLLGTVATVGPADLRIKPRSARP